MCAPMIRLLVAFLVFALVASQSPAGGRGNRDPSPSSATPPAQLVLPLPDPAACNRSVIYELTDNYRACSKAFQGRQNPDEACCQGLATYYGPNSTRPSRNCFCIASYWEEFSQWEEPLRYSFSTAFLMCSNMGYVIPYYSSKRTGYCFGIPPDAKTLANAYIRRPPSTTPPEVRKKVTANAYLSKINQDDLVAFAFATSVISGFGVVFMVWPLLWEAGYSAKQAWSKLRA